MRPEKEARLAELVADWKRHGVWIHTASELVELQHEAFAERDAEIARLRDALERYGWHSCGCQSMKSTGQCDKIYPCTCGLDAAKKGMK